MQVSIGRATAHRHPTEVGGRADFGRTAVDLRPIVGACREANAGTCVIAPVRRQEIPMLHRLAHLTVRHRWPVIGAWLLLTLFGGFAAAKVSTRWYQSIAVPGKPAYEASQRTLDALGVGARAPSVVVFHTSGDATKSRRSSRPSQRAAAAMPGALTSSYFSTGNLAYVSTDRHTAFAMVYPAGPVRLDVPSGAETMRAAAANGLPAGITVNVTGRDALGEASAEWRGSGATRPAGGGDRRRSARW